MEITKIEIDGVMKLETPYGNIVLEERKSYKDYEYMIMINSFGYRCGYVKIPATHSIYKTKETYDVDIEMYGNCSFIGIPICDITYDDKTKWIGFDCQHSFDYPDLEAVEKYGLQKETYQITAYERIVRDKEFVISECKKIIEQLIETDK